MRGRLLAPAVSGLLALVLTSCGGQDTAAPAEPATGVCADVGDCRVVAGEDLDGDGVRDQVGFVVASKRRVVVHVKTASGDELRRNLPVLWFPRGEFYGAAPIDGRPGAELVVGTNMGAHTLWFTTLSVQNGRLVRLDPPGAEDEWMIDGAFSFHAGVTRRVEDGRAVVVLHEAGRDGARPTFTGRDRTYVWRDGGWQHRSTTRPRYAGEGEAAQVGGWHVRGLPRFPAF
jgi:hypothetical protein